MSKATPRFSEEWLEQYRRRIGAEGGNAKEGTPKARARAGANPDGELTPYRAEASAVPIRGWDGKQTETEKRYNAQALGGAGRFEAVTLHLPGGGRYTPDFMTVDEGEVTFHEVKGSYRLHSQGRAWTAFREAAAAFPLWRFVWATERKGGGWDVKRYNLAAIGRGDS